MNDYLIQAADRSRNIEVFTGRNGRFILNINLTEMQVKYEKDDRRNQ